MKKILSPKWFLHSVFAMSVTFSAIGLAGAVHADDEVDSSSPSSEPVAEQGAASAARSPEVAETSESSSGLRLEMPRFRLEDYGAGLGGGDQGIAFNGNLSLSSPDGSWARLRGTVGVPLLQLNGRTELIPVRLVRTPIDVGSPGHELQFRLDIVPISADAQLQAAFSSEGSNHHLIIDPSLAAELDWLSPESMGLGARIRTTLGPAGGVIHDGDGTSGIFGIRVGFETGVNLSVTDLDEIDFLCGVDLINALHSGVAPTSTRTRCELGYRRTLGEEGTLRLALVSESSSFDVQSSTNADDGWTEFTGIGVSFSPSRSVRSSE